MRTAHSEKKWKAGLAAAAGLEPHQVIIYCPSFGMSLPEAEVPVRMEGAQTVAPFRKQQRGNPYTEREA